jgi:hypothetical protein
MFSALFIAACAMGGLAGDASLRPAQAQEIMAEFRETLGGYGQWVEHPRWGEVWVPDGVPADWRPYRSGHWVYTDEWGWYWVADEEWGWIAYHYGRWVFDHDLRLGWIWVPGTDWSPAWVSWRRGDDAIGWAPMPPAEIYLSVQDEPDYWLFVRAPDIVAPSLAVVILPPPQTVVYVRQTVIINQTVIVRRNNTVIVANPGVPPSFVAAKIGRPIQTVSVQPHVMHGTVGVTGAVVGPHPHGLPVREMVRPQPKVIQPAAHIPPPIPFKSGQAPTLGPDAPNALKRAGLGSGSPGGPGQSGHHSALLPAKPAAVIPSTMPSPASRYPASLPGTSVAPGSVARSGSATPSVAGHTPAPVQPPAGYERESFPNSGRRGLSAPMVQGLSAPMVHAPPSQQHFRRPDGALQLPPDVTARRSPPGNVDPPIHAHPNAAIPPAAPRMGQAPRLPTPQSVGMHPPPSVPARAAPPPQPHPQRCRTINGQQVCR